MSDSGMLVRLTEAIRESWRLRLSRRRPIRKSADHSTSSLFLRAHALSRAGDHALALEILKQATDLDPTFTDAMEAQAEILDLAGDSAAASSLYDAARQARERVRAGTPDRHYIRRQRGPAVAELLAYSAVIKSLQKNALPYLARGNAYMAAGNPKQALADYERALKFQPDRTDVFSLMGEALFDLGDYKKAVECFDRSLAIRSTDADALSARGIAKLALGDLDKANADWRMQLRLFPGASIAAGYIALRLADYGTAIKAFEGVASRKSDDPYRLVYHRSALLRLNGHLSVIEEANGYKDWPALLLALQDRRVDESKVFAAAGTATRQAEVHFQLAMLNNRETGIARWHWEKVLELAPVDFIEYAAARNELARLVAK